MTAPGNTPATTPELPAHDSMAALADVISEVFGPDDRRHAHELVSAMKDRRLAVCDADALGRHLDALRSLVIDLRSEVDNMNHGPQYLNAETAYGYSMGWSNCADAILARHGFSACVACGGSGVVAVEGACGWCPQCPTEATR